MFRLDEDILRCYFRLEEYQRQRIRMERLWHPEKMKWSGGIPQVSETKGIRREELAKMGFTEAYYQQMLQGENEAYKEIERLVIHHPLWPHFERIKGLGHYLAGAFVAAGGDIQRPPTASAFWYGMGLDVLSDGTVPRRKRGLKDVERKVPALPHVTRVGEQIRQQLLRSGGFAKGLYDKHKADYVLRYPDRPAMFAHKHGLRIAQKILYACLWEKWREAYNLPAPWPYAFTILYHEPDHRITIVDFYSK